MVSQNSTLNGGYGEVCVIGLAVDEESLKTITGDNERGDTDQV